MLKDFKDFINRGNVFDMAIGVIIGGAFGKIVSSLVNDILMPLIGKLTGGLDFSNLFVSLDGTSYNTLQAAEEAGAAVLKYGSFIQSVLDFLIIAFCIFMMVKAMMKVKKQPAPADPTTKTCTLCKTEIPIGAVKCPHCTGDISGK